jgi:hypothetical protein
MKRFIFSQRKRRRRTPCVHQELIKQIRSVTLCQQNFNSNASFSNDMAEEGVGSRSRCEKGARDATYVSVCQRSCGSDVMLWDQCSHGHMLTYVRHGVNGECNTCFLIYLLRSTSYSRLAYCNSVTVLGISSIELCRYCLIHKICERIELSVWFVGTR